MAHQICIQGGKVHMMYCGEVPWHGLGTPLTDPGTSAEAMEAAHLDWKVKKVALWAAEFGIRRPVPKTHALVRADLWDAEGEKCPIFGIVSDAYTPVQNADAFAFLDSIVGEGSAAYHTAGALGNGERVWMLVKLPHGLRVKRDDITDKYLLLANDHRGTGTVQVKFTPVRVVCNNTLTLALSTGSLIRVPHWRNAKERLIAAGEKLGIIDRQFQDLGKRFCNMANIQLKRDGVAKYLAAVFPMPEKANERARKQVEDNRALAEHLFDQGRGNRMPGINGSLWAALNGVTELIDHRVSKTLSSERRLNSIWFGTGASVKQRAYEYAMNLTDGKDLPDGVARPQGVARRERRGFFRWLGGQNN